MLIAYFHINHRNFNCRINRTSIGFCRHIGTTGEQNEPPLSSSLCLDRTLVESHFVYFLNDFGFKSSEIFDSLYGWDLLGIDQLYLCHWGSLRHWTNFFVAGVNLHQSSSDSGVCFHNIYSRHNVKRLAKDCLFLEIYPKYNFQLCSNHWCRDGIFDRQVGTNQSRSRCRRSSFPFTSSSLWNH